MLEAVERFRVASAQHDLVGMLADCSPDVRFASPVSGSLVFQGARDVGLSALALVLGVKLLRHPSVLVRAARAGR